MKLSPAKERFILHWGEMGTKWGINRTVAQVHALLYLAAKPLPADEIATTLSVARSNVGTPRPCCTATSTLLRSENHLQRLGLRTNGNRLDKCSG